MSEQVKVRFAEAADAPLLARMLHDFNLEFGDPSPGTDVLERRVAAFIADGQFTFLLGGEGPDGFAQVSFNPTVWSDHPVAYVAEFYVAPERACAESGLLLMIL